MSNTRKELVLRTITLRGIGPYREGSRLDIKPLTILCGENGSGKSTWFKALNLLERSQEGHLLPFAFAEASDYDHDLTNAYLKQFPEEMPLNRDADNQFGPLGTIGLHFEAIEDLSLDHENPADASVFADTGSLPQAFLWQGQCQKGTQFRLRLAHPSTRPNPEEVENPSLRLYDLIELRINEIYCIRFRKRLGEAKYAFECSRAFLPGHDEDEDGTVCFAQVEVEGGEAKVHPVDGSSAFDLLEPLCRAAILRIRQLLREILGGFFYISAIRQIETRKNFLKEEETNEDRQAAIRHRYVGPQGEQTWDLESAFAYNPMQLAPDHRGMEPATQDFAADQILDWGGIWEARDTPAARRILELANTESWEKVTKAVDRRDVVQSEEYGTADVSELLAAKFRTSQESWKINEAVAAFFNTVLGYRNLCRKEVWANLEGEAQFLVRQGPENLTEPEVRRLNRRLIQVAFNRPGRECISRVPRFCLEMCVSYWLKKLVQTRIVLTEAQREYPSLGDYWTNESAPPVGFLANQNPERGPRSAYDADEEDIPERNPTSLERFLHLCFDGGSPTSVSPGFLSAGFHQVAPLVVQGAILRQNEIMGVENPEVHLHPSLQLDIAEYLIREAEAGKVIVIETHSDLVVRRVLRAILREEIRQARVAVYFASLKRDESDGYHYASLEPIQINDQGQVANWPKGFMDDDVRESRRLMETTYGTIPNGEEFDDEEAEE